LLAAGALTREQLDAVAKASNGPQLVAQLRRRGLDIPCDRRCVTDADDKTVRPGLYHLTHADRRKLSDWKNAIASGAPDDN
jgi:hypothetical protein